MNEIWVMSVTTSLPEVHFFEAMQNQMFAFDSFSKAREALRKLLKSYAFSSNAMFDGNGNVTYMKRYLDAVEDFDDVEDEAGWLNTKVSAKVQSLFRDVFSGKDTLLDLAPDVYNDCLIQVAVTSDSIAIYGSDDGPINGCCPTANTNMFAIEEEKDYYLYLNDMFGNSPYEASAELYIDLKKVTVQ